MLLLTSLDEVSDSVHQSVLARIKLRILCPLIRFDFLKNFALLLQTQLLTVDASILGLDSRQACRILLLLLCASILSRLLLQFGRLDVVLRLVEVQLDVGVDAANLIVGLALHDIDGVVPATILNVDCVTFVKHGVVGQFLLEDGFGVRQLDEGRVVRSDLDVGPLLQIHVSQDDLGALFDAQVVHHPNRDVAHALLRRELKHTAVGLQAHLRVRNHERHRVLDAHPRQFVEC